MRKLIFQAILLIFLGMCALSGCSADNSTASSTMQTAGVKNSGIVYLMAGKLESNEKVDLTSKISARIAEINFDVGSYIKKGDPVIKLDSKDLEAQVEQAQAGVDTAKANLIKLQKGARPEQIAQAQAAADSAKSSYESAKRTYERNKQLFDAGALSQSQLEQSQTALAGAEAVYKSAEETLNILNRGETPEAIKVLQAQLQQAEAVLELAQVQLSNGTIASPVSGVVAAKSINAGELAPAGAPLATVVNLDDIIVNAYLPSSMVNKVKQGQETVIKVSEIPDKVFDGEISLIDSVVDSKTRNVLVKVRFKHMDPLLKPGMFAEIGLKN